MKNFFLILFAVIILSVIFLLSIKKEKPKTATQNKRPTISGALSDFESKSMKKIQEQRDRQKKKLEEQQRRMQQERLESYGQ